MTRLDSSQITSRIICIFVIYWIIYLFFPFENTKCIHDLNQFLKTFLSGMCEEITILKHIDWSEAIEKLNRIDFTCFLISFLNIGLLGLGIIAIYWITDIYFQMTEWFLIWFINIIYSIYKKNEIIINEFIYQLE